MKHVHFEKEFNILNLYVFFLYKKKLEKNPHFKKRFYPKLE